VAGLATTFGSGAMTNAIHEIPDTKVLFVIGSNPTEAHPVIGAKMRQALRKGAKLIVADPRKTEVARKADVWLQLRPGTDIALVNGLLHIILQSGWQNQEFIDSHTINIDKVAAVVEKYTPAYVTEITGVPENLLYEAARLYSSSDGAQIFYTMGITEHVCGTDNVISLANLAMATGNIGRPGAGVNPLRGQNNVQGACDMGALPNVYPGYQNVTVPAIKQKFEKAWNATLSDKVGLTSPDMFDAIGEGKLKALYIMGEDPVLSDANANHARKTLAKLDLLVIQTLFLSETAKLADVVFPASTFAEKNGTFSNTERRIQRVRKAIESVGGSRPDGDIIMDLSTRMGYPMSYHHPSEIMDEIAALTPIYAGVSFERLEQTSLQWPVPTKEHPGTQFLHANGNFSCGLGVFTPVEHQPPAELPNAQYPFLLMTGCILYHHRVSTATHSKHLTEHRPEERIMIHPEDAHRLQITNDEMIAVTSRRGRVAGKTWVTDNVPQGMIWMSFHFPDCPTNQLTNDAGDTVTQTPEYKVCAVQIEKIS
jgi:formate dehydrogenase alpha subunit